MLFTVTIYCLVALGLNIVVGYAGLLDLGYVGFYAIGAYTVGDPDVVPRAAGRSCWRIPIAVVGDHDLRRAARRADAARPRRLPGDRDARASARSSG